MNKLLKLVMRKRLKHFFRCDDKWWQNEKTLAHGDFRYNSRMELYDKLEKKHLNALDLISKLEKENFELRKVICNISDAKIKKAMNKLKGEDYDT